MSRNDLRSSPITGPIKVGLSIFVLSALAVVGWFCWTGEKPETIFRRALVARSSSDRIRLFQQALTAAKGDYTEAKIHLCLELARIKDWDQLEQNFESLDARACTPRQLTELAQLCLDGEQWRTAELVLTRADAASIDAEARLLLLCALYQGTGRNQDFMETARALTKVKPGDARYWWLLAQIQEQLDNTTDAIRVYQFALSQSLPAPEITNMRRRLVELSLDVGDAKLARQQVDALLGSGARGPEMHVFAARLAHLEGHPKQALDALEIALRELGENPEALRLRGILHLELGQLLSAESDLKQVTALTPSDEIAFFKLAEVYRRLSQGEQAPHYEKLARQNHETYLTLHRKKLKAKQLARPDSKLPINRGGDQN